MKKAIEILKSCLADQSHGATMVYSIMTRIKQAIALLKEQPKIVRCKDCKYSPSNGAMTELLPSYLACKSVPRMEDYFCADGEPKDGEQI